MARHGGRCESVERAPERAGAAPKRPEQADIALELLVHGVGGTTPEAMLGDPRTERITGDDTAIAKCFLLWAGLVGAISLEVFGQYGSDTVTDPRAVFDIQIRMLMNTLTT